MAPKLEFELVREISPPLSVKKCSEKPMAKIDTACTIELFDALM